MPLIIKSNNSSITINAGNNDTIKRIKEKIQEKEDIPPELQRLIFSNTILEDNKTLNDYNIKGEETIELKTLIQIFVKTLTGESIVINIHPDDTVLDLKKLIEKKKPDIKTKMQRIIYEGKQLADDNKNLKEYNIQKEATLHLVLRLEGGVF